jgi:hypothetical protein
VSRRGRYRNGPGPRPGVLHDASAIYRDAAARGERLSQRMLARQLRRHGHRFPNEHLRLIADSIGLSASKDRVSVSGVTCTARWRRREE